MSKLAGKNILITGASQGLGREMALRFARESAAGLSLVGRQADQLNKVCDEIRKIASTIDIVVVRALESAVGESGRVRAQHGYTRLRIDNEHRLKAVDGLLTGLHEPEASHLDLLSAFLPAEQIRAAYEEAVERRYLWHEFGDLNLIL